MAIAANTHPAANNYVKRHVTLPPLRNNLNCTYRLRREGKVLHRQSSTVHKQPSEVKVERITSLALRLMFLYLQHR